MARKTNVNIGGTDYYRIRRKVGEDEKGKSIFRAFYGKNKAEAEAKVREWEQRKEAGVDPRAYMSQTMQYYMDNVFMKGDHADGTKRRYETAYRLRIKGSELSLLRMGEITPIAIQNFFNALSNKGLKYGQLAPTLKVLTLFFDWAHDVGYGKNPMPTIKLPKPTKKDAIETFTDEEVQKIVDGTKQQNSHNHFLFVFALGTGLRQGELLGLKYGDIKDGVIRVERQAITDTDGSRKIDRTKTANATRDVPMPPTLQERFKEYKAAQERTGKHDLVFPTRDGNIMDATNLIRSYKRFLQSIDLPYKPFHTLRKTYCTRLCKAGVPIQVAASIMGHSSIAVTAQYYTFIEAKEKSAAAAKIGDIF